MRPRISKKGRFILSNYKLASAVMRCIKNHKYHKSSALTLINKKDITEEMNK